MPQMGQMRQIPKSTKLYSNMGKMKWIGKHSIIYKQSNHISLAGLSNIEFFFSLLGEMVGKDFSEIMWMYV